MARQMMAEIVKGEEEKGKDKMKAEVKADDGRICCYMSKIYNFKSI